MTKGTCSVDGCERRIDRRDWCNPHYRRWLKHGDPAYERPAHRCSIDGCDAPMLARGWCKKHYQRWKAHGDPSYERPRRGCSVEGCSAPHKGHGYCNRHLKRWRLYGDALVAKIAWSAGGASGACSITDCNESAFARALCPSHYARWDRYGDPEVPLKRLWSTRETHNRDGLRLCTGCDVWKPTAAYHSCVSRPYETRCRTCRGAAVAEWHRAWKAANPEEFVAQQRRNSWLRRGRQMANWVEDVDRDVLFVRDEGFCGVCGIPVDPADWEADHIYPVVLGGEHSYANMQVTHPSCNSVKSKRVLPLPDAEIAALREAHRHLERRFLKPAA